MPNLIKYLLPILLVTIFTFKLSNSALAEDLSSTHLFKVTKSDSHKPIKLGYIVPLSGPLAFFGKSIQQSVEMAVRKRPELERLIEFVWEDSMYDAKQSISAFHKLHSMSKVDLIYSFGGPMLNVLAPISEGVGLPFFATESETSDCEGKSYCLLFRNSSDEWGKAVWHVLRKKGYKRIGIVKNQNQFMNTFVSAIERTKAPAEEVITILDVTPDTQDFRTLALKVKSKASSIDALGVFLLPNSHKAFIAGMKSTRTSIPMLGVEEFMVVENNKGYEDLTEGTISLTPAVSEWYYNEFTKRYGYSAGIYYAVAAYDFLNLLADVMKEDSSLRRIELVNAMQFTGKKQGEGGEYQVKLSEKGVPSYSFPIAVHSIQNGAPVTIEEIKF